MDRREFLRAASIGTLTASAGGITGCARLLDWSEAQHVSVVRREFGRPAPSANATPGLETTTGLAASRWPDLAVMRGDDPVANVAGAIGLLGGMGRFVPKGARVVIKPNILTAKEPKFGVTTNPSVIGTLVKLCWEAGAKDVVVLDNPTSPARQAYTVSGIWRAVSDADGRMKVLTDRDFELIEIPHGQKLAQWPLVTDVFDADVFINVPCAKTHGLAGLTLSMKNLMGIMGGARGTIHQSFADKIVDINAFVLPHLTVLDATRLLVRNGPSGGSLADVEPGNTVVAGTNQVSVDAYGATLFARTPLSLEYVRLAEKRGLGIADLSKLTIAERRA
jgi:uncharacterized protein (DUF362 family)